MKLVDAGGKRFTSGEKAALAIAMAVAVGSAVFLVSAYGGDSKNSEAPLETTVGAKSSSASSQSSLPGPQPDDPLFVGLLTSSDTSASDLLPLVGFPADKFPIPAEVTPAWVSSEWANDGEETPPLEGFEVEWKVPKSAAEAKDEIFKSAKSAGWTSYGEIQLDKDESFGSSNGTVTRFETSDPDLRSLKIGVYEIDSSTSSVEVSIGRQSFESTIGRTDRSLAKAFDWADEIRIADECKFRSQVLEHNDVLTHEYYESIQIICEVDATNYPDVKNGLKTVEAATKERLDAINAAATSPSAGLPSFLSVDAETVDNARKLSSPSGASGTITVDRTDAVPGGSFLPAVWVSINLDLPGN